MAAWESIERSPEYLRLLDHLDEHRDDEDAWSVLGDLLLGAGHPRGELIALEAELKRVGKGAEAKRLNEARAQVIAGNRAALLGSDAVMGDLLLTWRHGFIERAEVPARFVHADALRELRTHPSGRFLDELVTTAPMLQVYAEEPAPLRHLILRGETQFDHRPVSLEDEVSQLAAASVDVLVIGEFSRRLPKLSELTITGPHVFIDGLRAALETITIVSHPVEAFGLLSFLSAYRLPTLVLRESVSLVGTLPRFGRKGPSPTTLIVDASLDENDLVVIGRSLRDVPLQNLDLSRAKVSTRALPQLIATLQGSLKHVKVRLPASLRDHPKIKPILAARKLSGQ